MKGKKLAWERPVRGEVEIPSLWSYHVANIPKLLRDAGMVQSTREGRELWKQGQVWFDRDSGDEESSLVDRVQLVPYDDAWEVRHGDVILVGRDPRVHQPGGNSALCHRIHVRLTPSGSLSWQERRAERGQRHAVSE